MLGKLGRKLKARRASTLIIAVWSLFLLTTFAVQLGVIVRQKVTVVRRIDDRDKLFFIADAGVKYAIARLREEDALYDVDFLAERWSDQEDLFKRVKVGDGSFQISFDSHGGESSRLMYGLQDEESKINLNKADAKVITQLLKIVAGLTHNQAEELAYCMIDWRDNDSFFQHSQYGAEDSDYKSRESAYESKDSDYEVIEELLLVKNMSQEIYDKIKPFVTAYGEGKININTAPREVFLAIGADALITGNIISFRNGGDLIAGTGDDDIFLFPATIVSRLSQTFDMSPSEVALLSNLVSEGRFVTKSENFMIQSTATLADPDKKRVIVAVADRTGMVKYWRDEI